MATHALAGLVLGPGQGGAGSEASRVVRGFVRGVVRGLVRGVAGATAGPGAGAAARGPARGSRGALLPPPGVAPRAAGRDRDALVHELVLFEPPPPGGVDPAAGAFAPP
jgi:hypothetical protein